MSQASELPGNAAQVEYWNAGAGDTWASLRELLDRQMAPLEREALRGADDPATTLHTRTA
jgi:hypothetical protein